MPTCVLTEIAKRAAGGLTFKACLFPFPNSNQTHFRHSFRPDMVARNTSMSKYRNVFGIPKK